MRKTPVLVKIVIEKGGFQIYFLLSHKSIPPLHDLDYTTKICIFQRLRAVFNALTDDGDLPAIITPNIDEMAKRGDTHTKRENRRLS
jgi:hypothetical protein